MAKVNTNKARKLSGVRVDLPDEDNASGYPLGQRWRYVLRSDGTVLRSYQCCTRYPNQAPYWGSNNYKIIGKVRDMATFDLVRFATKRHPTGTVLVDNR